MRVQSPQYGFLFCGALSDGGSGKESAQDRKVPRRRTAFSKEQLAHLENVFQKCHYPKIDLRMMLASKTQLPETCIQVWFKNRRAKHRKKQRNMANPEIPADAFVPKFNTVITWRPNSALFFTMSTQNSTQKPSLGSKKEHSLLDSK